MSIVGTVLLQILKKYWKQIAVVLILAVLIVTIRIQHTRNESLEEKITNLETTIKLKSKEIENRDRIISVQEKSMEIFNHLDQREKESEHHYHEKVIENEKVIEKYIEKEDDSEALKRHYDWLNNKWNRVDNLDWYTPKQ